MIKSDFLSCVSRATCYTACMTERERDTQRLDKLEQQNEQHGPNLVRLTEIKKLKKKLALNH